MAGNYVYRIKYTHPNNNVSFEWMGWKVEENPGRENNGIEKKRCPGQEFRKRACL